MSNTFRLTSTEPNPVEDAKARIRKFWEGLGSPSIMKIVSSIEINGKHYEFLMMNDSDNGVTIIIK